jgi:hypothetical protein
MADGNAVLRDVVSSWQHCNLQRCSSRGCKLATLRRCYYSVAMAGQVDRLFYSDGAGRCRNFCFFLLDSFNGLFYAREKKNDKLLCAQEKKRKREPERESFETCLVSFFSAVGSSLPIFAWLVSTTQAPFSKLPSVSSFR